MLVGEGSSSREWNRGTIIFNFAEDPEAGGRLHRPPSGSSSAAAYCIPSSSGVRRRQLRRLDRALPCLLPTRAVSTPPSAPFLSPRSTQQQQGAARPAPLPPAFRPSPGSVTEFFSFQLSRTQMHLNSQSTQIHHNHPPGPVARASVVQRPPRGFESSARGIKSPPFFCFATRARGPHPSVALEATQAHPRATWRHASATWAGPTGQPHGLASAPV